MLLAFGYLTNPPRKHLSKIRKIKLLGGGEALFLLSDTELHLYNLHLELFETIVRVFGSLNPPSSLSVGDCSQLSSESMLHYEQFQTGADT